MDSHEAMPIDKKQFREFLYLTNLCGMSSRVKTETKHKDLVMSKPRLLTSKKQQFCRGV